jgi:hypothetical protein
LLNAFARKSIDFLRDPLFGITLEPFSVCFAPRVKREAFGYKANAGRNCAPVFQARVAPRMIAFPLALRKPPKRAVSALQPF